MGGEPGGRSTPRLIADTFGLYRRYPWLFLVLAAAVIVPYELAVLAVIGEYGSDANLAISFPFSLFDLVVVGPLVSALHVHAVSDVRQGDEPRLMSIAKRGLAALPVVCAATIMSWLGIFSGFLLLLVPGLVLLIRWFVVAQVAAIEREGWVAALRRSWTLTEGDWIHVLVFIVCVGLLTSAPSVLVNRVLGGHGSSAGAFLVGTAVGVVVISFTALATALLYYDLRTRREALAAQGLVGNREAPHPVAPHPMAAPLTEHGIDPRAYSDDDRPKGWYIDPDRPKRMLFWDGNDRGRWHGETRTPRKLRAQWEERNP